MSRKIGKMLKITICLLLIMTMVLNLPCGHLCDVFAQEISKVTEEEIVTEEALTDIPEDTYVEEGSRLIGEHEEKREQNVKHFMREDGLVEAVYYPYSVHYDKNGEWEDIDNSLVEVKVDGQVYYENKANSFKISFAKESLADALVSLENEGSTLSWSIPEMDASNLTQEEVSQSDDIRFKNNLFSKVTYEDAINGVDVTYMLTPSGVKEYFIIENEEELESFNDITIVMKTDKLDVSKSEDKLHLKNAGKEKFTLSEPVMFDATNDFVSTIPFEVKEIGKHGERLDVKEEVITAETSNEAATYEPDIEVEEELSIVTESPVIESAEEVVEIQVPEYSITERSTAISIDESEDDLITEEPLNAELTVETEEPEEEIIEESETLEETEEPTDKTALYINELEEDINADEDVNYYTYTIEIDKESIKEAEITYPLIIDPDIIADSSQENMIDAYVSQKEPEKNHGNEAVLKIGYGSTSLINRAYVKAASLPKLSEGDMVVGAKYYMVRYSDYGDYDHQLNLHIVTTDWTESGIVWNNQPIYNNLVASSDFSKYVDSSEAYVNEFDITQIVKQWYANTLPNYGMVIKNANETTGYHQYRQSEHWDNEYVHQILDVIYVNTIGVESTYSYHELAVGRAGTTYINDATGNVTHIHSDAKTNDTKLPIELSHVFDNNNKDTNCGYGAGWKINYDQSVEAVTIEQKNYYKYIDGDGTIHYYYQDGNVYYDEGNKLNKLTVSNGIVTIEDTASHIKYSFNSAGKLRMISDSNGNTKLIGRNNLGYIDRITNTAGDVVSLQYENNLLKSITEENGDITTFDYVNGLFLVQINYSDGEVTKFAYDDWSFMRAEDIAGYKVELSYTGNPKQVSKVTEYANNVAYDYLTFSYRALLTTVTDKQGRTNHYRFNKYGQLINEHDDDGSAVFYDYMESTPGKKNSLSASSEILSTSINLIENSSFENNGGSTISSWVLSNEANATGHIDSVSDGYIGNYGLGLLRIDKTGISKVYTDVPITPGKTYDFSLYYKGSMGGYIYAEYTDSSGRVTTKEKKVVWNGDEWFKNSITVTVPSTAQSTLRVGIMEKGEMEVLRGVCYIDAVQLAESGSSKRYNLIKNADFRNGFSCWEPNELTTSDSCITTVAGSEYRPENLNYTVFRVYGDINTTKSLYQVVAEEGGANNSYVVGAYAKTEGIPKFTHKKQNQTSEVTYGRVILRVEFQNGSTTVTKVEKEFSPDTSDWQYLSFKATATAAFTKIKVSLCYDKNLNVAYFDGVSLYKDGYGSIFEYDDKNNLTKIVTKDGRTYQYEYDTNNNLKKSIDEYGTVTEYEYYPNNHNIKSVKSQGKVTAYEYDARGNVTKTKTYDEGNPNLYYISSSTYGSNKKLTDTDARNNTVNYTYRNSDGRLESVEDAKNTYFYTYGKLGKLTDVCAINMDLGVAYEYSDDNLSKIRLYDEWGTRFSYSFNYNAFGQLTASFVGLRMLSSNTYDNETKLLTKTTYGNGDGRQYIYDKKEQITNIKDEIGGPLVNYFYNEDGTLNEEQDYMAFRKTYYDYDDNDRVIRELSESWPVSIAGTSTSVTYSYDNKDRVSKAKREIGDYSWEEEYTYDEETLLPNKFTTTDGVSQTVSYDALGRVSSKQLGNNTSISMSYTYTDGAVAGSTTGLVKSFTAYNHATSTYTYDETGLITKIANPVYGTTEYKYNQFSQLQEEYDQYADTTTQYQYDDGGNISYKYIYHGEASNPDSVELKYYTYDTTYSDTEDGVWDDLLIAYDGETILYDEIGNPTKYLGYETLSWEGRNLNSIKDGNTTVATYTYNSDGIRVEKTVSGTDTEYIYSGGQLSAMKVGDDMLYFTYDANGEVVSVRYNGINYYYIKNPQGDVISLCRESGVTECLYSYDAWGKPIMEPTSGIGAINPFRYRGYIYDAETGFYYLQSRYYDPEVGRFINADDTAYLGFNGDLNSYNLFVYCGNNPINRKDINGNFWVAALVGATVNVATTFIAAKATGQEYTWADFGIAALSGAVNAIPVVGTVLSGVITGTYAGYMCYTNGATVGEAVLCGTVAGTLAASSISNLANISGPTLDVATTAFVDLVYGTAFNTISAATYKGITNNAQVRNKTSNNTNSVLVNKSSVPTPQKKPWKTKTYVYSYGVRI